MSTVTKNNIISELDDFPEEKLTSLLDYLHFLKKEDEITKEEEEQIKESEEEIKKGKGVNWRDARRDV